MWEENRRGDWDNKEKNTSRGTSLLAGIGKAG